MNDHADEFSLRAMCRAFGVARSGYDAWVSQGCTTQQARADAVLAEHIRAVFEQRGQTYGSPRIYAELKAQGVRSSRRRLARLMRSAGLAASPARRRAHTTQVDARQPSVTNRLQRDFTADAPNRKSVVDITGVWTDEGWLYLAGGLGHGRPHARGTHPASSGNGDLTAPTRAVSTRVMSIKPCWKRIICWLAFLTWAAVMTMRRSKVFGGRSKPN